MSNIANGNRYNKDVSGRILDMDAEVRKIWGDKWNEATVEYEFSGKKFVRRTEDAAIYATSPDH